MPGKRLKVCYDMLIINNINYDIYNILNIMLKIRSYYRVIEAKIDFN